MTWRCWPSNELLFGALDPLTRDRVQQFFLRIRKETGLTAVFVTHDMVEALLLADRIAVMYEGKIIGIVDPQTATREEVGLMMAGVAQSETA